MMLTIHTLFNDPNIVNAVIQRVLKTRKDTIYWQQYLGFRRWLLPDKHRRDAWN